MDKPYIITQVSASLDGRISLRPNITMFEDLSDDSQSYDIEVWTDVTKRIESLHQPEADMLGSNSMIKEGEELRKLPEYRGDVQALYKDYLPDEVINRAGHKGWLVVVDGRGRVRSGYKGSEDRPGWHTLHLVSFNVSPEYLAFLHKNKIPYLISGKKLVNLKQVMKKMKLKLGVRSLVHTSGGKLAGALLKAKLIDEINIIIRPEIIGGFKTPTLFESPDLKKGEYPTQLKLITAQIQSDGYIWIRYKVNYKYWV